MLLRAQNLQIAFGLNSLLDNAHFQIDKGERVAIIGRNGAGKSTFMKVLLGTAVPDHGELWYRPGLRLGFLDQELPTDTELTVYDWVAEGLQNMGALLKAYHGALHQVGDDPTEENLATLSTLQHQLEAENGWDFHLRIDAILERLALPKDSQINDLSGGWQRRCALARALVNEPDLLVLDEPTNHLDLEVIEWLETQLSNWRGALLFVTHDRTLLQKLATRIIELDRGQLHDWPGDYPTFLAKKADFLNAEAQNQAKFDKFLAEEEVWIRQGIKARRTRNEGRVRRLEAMRQERQQRRELQGKAKIQLDQADVSGELVVETKNLHYAIHDADHQRRVLVADFSMRIMRGDKIGLIGPNGSGKTTLLRLLLGQLTPQAGSVRLGTKLQTAYFDQRRAALNPNLSVIENISEGRDFIEIGEQKRHVISYLGDFLFTPQRARTPVNVLSGGERNRLLIAKLFSQPANVLVLDEPTNDLDMETLELLEEKLLEFSGTLLLVSHDRAFLDAVATSVLVFEGDGQIGEYVGGYSDWLRQKPPLLSAKSQTTSVKVGAPKPAQKSAAVVDEKRKLSYREQQELEKLPAKIEALEQLQQELNAQLADSAVYRGDANALMALQKQLQDTEAALQTAYHRWETLM